jgi:hypothetical protein
MVFQLRSDSQWVLWEPKSILWLFSQSHMHNCDRTRQNPHINPNLWSEDYYGGEDKMGMSRAASIGKISILSLEGWRTIRHLKDTVVVFPTTPI